MTNGNVRTGVVKKIPTDRESGLRKGYGFIADDNGGGEFFFHASTMDKSTEFSTLPEGARVSYAIEDDKGRGPRAASVKAI